MWKPPSLLRIPFYLAVNVNTVNLSPVSGLSLASLASLADSEIASDRFLRIIFHNLALFLSRLRSQMAFQRKLDDQSVQKILLSAHR